MITAAPGVNLGSGHARLGVRSYEDGISMGAGTDVMFLNKSRVVMVDKGGAAWPIGGSKVSLLESWRHEV